MTTHGKALVVVMPGIHVLLCFENAKTWMAGNISAFTRVFDALCPAMTERVATPS